MTIKTRLKATGIFLLIFALLIVGSLLFSKHQIDKAIEKGKIAGEINKGATQLDMLSRAYALYLLDRPKTQWDKQYDTLTGILNEGKWNSPEKEIIDGLKVKQARAKSIFNEMIVRREEVNAGSEPLRQLRKQSLQRLMTQLIATTQSMSSDAYLMAKGSAEEISRSQQRIFFVILVLCILFIGIIGFAFLRLYLGIVKPLKTIDEATVQIAAGRFDVKAPETDDEIGQLGRSFNTMGNTLKTLYRSLSVEIDERKKIQAALQESHDELEIRVRERTAELEASNKEHESFTYTVSHDLRAPLRAIDGFSKILSNKYQERLDDEGNRVLHIIRKNAQEMGRLIDDLLSFSRLGRQQVNLSEIDMMSLAKTVYDDQNAPHSDRIITFDVKDAPSVRADKILIRQVLVNLFSNAVKFTKPRTDAVIEFGGRKNGNENIYYVKDNGVGFDMSYADKLFGIFERLHDADEFEGTGVGLAIVLRAVQKHGGSVWAEAKINEGATIYFSLPQ
jgi:signal transduction histidine kinase